MYMLAVTLLEGKQVLGQKAQLTYKVCLLRMNHHLKNPICISVKNVTKCTSYKLHYVVT
jgi:hypothetical protein